MLPSGRGCPRKKGAWYVVRGVLILKRPLAKAAFFLLLVFSFSLAQSLPEPVDPLKRAEPEPGKLTFTASLGYTPAGTTAVGFDEARGPYTDQIASHAFTADLALSYALSETLSLGMGLAGALRYTQTLRTFADESQSYRDETETDLTPRIALAYRLAPEHPLDPELSLVLSHPWAASASLSLSFLRDPTVLSLSLEATHGFNPPYPTALGASFGAGFVANDRVSYRITASLSQPMAYARAPTLAAAFGADLALDPESKRSVSLTLSASLRGGEVWAGVSLGVSARGLGLVGR